jgi:outer membrane immunogenic protein
MFRKAIVGAAIFAAAGCAATAASAATGWTGFYAGVNAGYGGDRFEYPLKGDFAAGMDTFSLDAKATLTSGGFLGGGQLGYNYETAEHWVFGAEADIAATDIEGKVRADGTLGGTLSGTARGDIGSKLSYLSTVRGRVGYDWNGFMLYGTGGLAFGDVKTGFGVNVSSGGSTLFAASDSRSSTATGWTAGTGIEYAIDDHLSFKTEYLYADLGRENLFNTPFSIMGGTGTVKLDVSTRVNIVRAGLNYRFD